MCQGGIFWAEFNDTCTLSMTQISGHSACKVAEYKWLVNLIRVSKYEGSVHMFVRNGENWKRKKKTWKQNIQTHKQKTKQKRNKTKQDKQNKPKQKKPFSLSIGLPALNQGYIWIPIKLN